MFQPRYTISPLLLKKAKTVSLLVYELNQRKPPELALAKLTRQAREIATFASVSIEGNPLPLTEVKKILKQKPENLRDIEREVLNYNSALVYLDTLLKTQEVKLSAQLILDIHAKVMVGLLPKYAVGRWRQKPVVVRNPQTGQIVFLPPGHQQVPELMTKLVKFVVFNKEKLDPLILAGIFHKQMVMIHPFMDGNGRATRLVTKVILAWLGLNTFNLFSFENYYNQNVTRYFQIVGEFGDYEEIKDKLDFTAWLEYFADGVIDELLRVKKALDKLDLSPKTQLQAHHKKILNFIKKHGFITDRDYAQLTDRAKATRALDFNKLINLGLIKRLGKGKNTYYVLVE